MKYDYLVIGAGISGMTTAAVLATEGYRVALIEKSARPAPLLRGFSRRGIYFDTGFHYTGGLAEGESLHRFLDYLVLLDALRIIPFDADGFDVVRCPGRNDFRFPVGAEPLRRRLLAEFPGESTAIDGYLTEIFQVCRSLPYLGMDAEKDGPAYFSGLDGPSLCQFLDRLTGNVDLKRLLGVHSLLYGVPPEEIPFILHAAIVGPYYQSVHGLQGGGGSLATAFESRLAELGVDLICGRGVRQILFSEGGTLQGVRLDDGETIAGNGCVATMHPVCLLEMVPEGVFRPIYRKRLAALEDSAAAFVLYAACERPPEFLHGRNLFLLNGQDGAESQTIYLTAAGEKAAGAAGFIAICEVDPETIRFWSESKTGRRPQGYNHYKRAMTDELLARIQRECQELSGPVEVLETATPLTMRDFVHAPSGALYGVKHRVGQFNPMPQTRAANLLLAGQATAAPGVLGGMLSGFLACETIVGRDRLRQKVKACR